MRKRQLTKQVGAMISEAMYQQLIEVSDEMEISASNFIRDAIQEKINKRKGEESNE
jgi:metal-responsive CopG/Arc/MetJ family transcriptional regulator